MMEHLNEFDWDIIHVMLGGVCCLMLLSVMALVKYLAK